MKIPWLINGVSLGWEGGEREGEGGNCSPLEKFLSEALMVMAGLSGLANQKWPLSFSALFNRENFNILNTLNVMRI